MTKNKIVNKCINCPHVLENIEDFGDGTGCAWYECRKTGSMMQEENECPLEMSAKEAINLLKSKLDGKTDTSWEWTEAIRQATEAIKETEWVPISIKPDPEDDEKVHIEGRLPDEGQEVLLSTIYGTLAIDTFYIEEEGSYFMEHDWDEITAWRPLPKPYKAESEEK